MKKPASLADTDGFDPNGDINDANDFAEQGWRYRSGTASQRSALPSDEKFVGLTWLDTDAGGFRRVWDGTAWKLRDTWGTLVNQSSDGTFGLVTVNHPLGVTPDWVVAIPADSTNEALDLIVDLVVWTRASSNVQVRVRRNDTNTWVLGTAVRFYLSMGCN